MKEQSYRTANVIIQNILEGILRELKLNPYQNKGIKKTHLMKYCKLKVSTAEKYFSKLEKAGYIEIIKEDWGQRIINLINITKLGKERYEWFVKINVELE